MALRKLIQSFGDDLGIHKRRLPLPPTIEWIVENRHRIKSHRAADPDHEEALASIYRLYLSIVAVDEIWMRNEIEYFWNSHHWTVSEIPDPKDPDPKRYTLLAAITYLLVRAFNANISLGLPRDAPPLWTLEEEEEFRSRPKKLETAPKWADKVPPLDTPLFLIGVSGSCPGSVNDRDADPDLAKKTIVMTRLGIFFR